MAVENAVTLTKGTGTTLSYDSRDGAGLYTPRTRDRTSLKQESDGSWTETQPDGTRLRYQTSSSPGVYGGRGLGFTRNLLGRGYASPSFGTPLQSPRRATANQPPLLTIDRERSYGPLPGSR